MDELEYVSSTGALPRPEVQIVPRAEQAARLGVTTQKIAETIRVATIGDGDAALAKVSVDNRLIRVRVQLDTDLRKDANRIGVLRVPTSNGGSVPLSAVADIRVADGPSKIDRLNRERKASIGANLPVGVALDTATAKFREVANSVELPAGVRVAETGDAEIQKELLQSFQQAMLLGLMLVLTVLILLFRNVIQPFTILFSLPLAIGGVAVGADPHGQRGVHAGADRHLDADGHRDEERDPDRRLRHRDDRARHEPLRGDDGGRAASAPGRSS